MVRIDPEIKYKIGTDVDTQIREQTKDIDENDGVNLFFDKVFESKGKKRDKYFDNILYVAKTENIKRKYLDDYEPSDLEKDIIKFLNEQRESGEITEEQYRDIMFKIIDDRKSWMR